MTTNVTDAMNYLLKIIMSTPFKILQYKSQALPLNGRHVVRNRLTHSLEVAQISKQLAMQVYGHDAIHQIVSIEMAGLVHDIGIPPFGHTGESSIREWCKLNGQQLIPKSVLSSDMKECYWDDFFNFDGNAQGMRILLRYPFDEKRLVSREVISAYFKYNKLPSPLYKKSGYFYSDKMLLESVLNQWNIDINIRSPASWLVEIGDDIAHSIGDIRDVIQTRLVTFGHFKEWLFSRIDREIRDSLLNTLPDYSADLSSDHFFNILLDRIILEISNHCLNFYPKLLINDCSGFYENNCLKLIKLIKKYITMYVYNNNEKVQADLTGYKGIHNVLDVYGRLLKLSRENFLSLIANVNFDLIYANGLEVDYKLASLLSKEWVLVYIQESINVSDSEEWHLRMHLIIDTLTAMTNQAVLDF